MRNLVAPTDLTPASDAHLSRALRLAGEAGGAVVVVAVLSGSLVDKGLDPEDAGRERRRQEDRAVAAARDQVARLGVDVDCEVLALFGDVAFDTLLVARNLGADGIVVAAGHPATDELRRTSPIPVIEIGSADV